MKTWEFHCPKCAFIELIKEYDEIFPEKIRVSQEGREKFVDDFLKKHFQDYNPDYE